ncbi:MAG: hypothetical protein KatS3mg030_148 [Saprospiraceae bacterium]|nr:MAG: hypothetical protein KatS3mg030_145 [Saprospiraceae bacterium]GIV31846.1 MAG: hypothetical protein KatS3mg030_148 [Saprospiraceae bacterium]
MLTQVFSNGLLSCAMTAIPTVNLVVEETYDTTIFLELHSDCIFQRVPSFSYTAARERLPHLANVVSGTFFRFY